MTDKLHCCFCGAELMINPRPFDGCVKGRCVNGDCRYAEWTFPLEIWQALIDGKKAQDALKVAKEYYVIYQNHTSPHGTSKAFISYCTGVDWFWNYDIERAEPFDSVYDAKQQIRVCKIPGAKILKIRRFTEINQ